MSNIIICNITLLYNTFSLYRVVVPTAGFWEHGGPSLAASASAAAASNSNLAASNNTNSQKNKEKKQANNNKADNKVDLTKNFQSWCRSSLESLNTDVDIETFMGFLQDIESPYEVRRYSDLYIKYPDLFVPPVLSDPCNIIFLMSKKN
jgi:hypothetical protein